MTRRRFLIGLSVLVAGCAIWYATRIRVVVTNISSTVIQSLMLRVEEQTFHFRDVQPGGSVSARFKPWSGDSAFEVRAFLSDGTMIHSWCGYLVWEDFGGLFHIDISTDGTLTCRRR
jgi:hypothetical protein